MFLLGAVLSPLALYGTFEGVLFTLLAVGAFLVGLIGVHKRNHWITTLMLVVLFVGGAWGATTEATSFWTSVFAVAGEALAQLGVYIALGLAASFLLWMWHVRRVCHARAEALVHYAKECVQGYTTYERENGCTDYMHMDVRSGPGNRVTKHRFVNTDVTEGAVNFCKTYSVGQPLPDELASIWQKAMTDERSQQFGFHYHDQNIANNSTVAKENVPLITSYAFFWPWHLVDVIFGDILAKLPRYFVRAFGWLYDFCGNVARFGLPKNI